MLSSFKEMVSSQPLRILPVTRFWWMRDLNQKKVSNVFTLGVISSMADSRYSFFVRPSFIPEEWKRGSSDSPLHDPIDRDSQK